MEPSWHCLGPSWDFLGPSWAVLWPSWSHLGPSWGPSRASLGGLVAVLGPSWDDLDGLVALFGHLRAILSCPGPACGHLGPILEPCWCNSGANLGAFRKFRKRLQATCQQGSRYKLKVPTTHTRRVLRWGVAFGNAGSKTLSLSLSLSLSHFGLCSLQAYSSQTSWAHLSTTFGHSKPGGTVLALFLGLLEAD